MVASAPNYQHASPSSAAQATTPPGSTTFSDCFIRTLKEQCLWARLYEDIEDLQAPVREFTRRYNQQSLIERHGHMTPREAYERAMEPRAA